jgi:hypothetical protein
MPKCLFQNYILRGRWQQEGYEGNEEGEVKLWRSAASAGLCLTLCLAAAMSAVACAAGYKA